MSSSYPTTHPDLSAQALKGPAKLTVPTGFEPEAAVRCAGDIGTGDTKATFAARAVSTAPRRSGRRVRTSAQADRRSTFRDSARPRCRPFLTRSHWQRKTHGGLITGDSHIGSYCQHRLSDQISANTANAPFHEGEEAASAAQ